MTGLSICLEAAVRNVLGSMCFATPEFLGPGPLPQSIVTAIRFSGDVSGDLRLALEESLARRLAADFLGCQAVTVELARSFSLELANVLCGHTLAGVAGAGRYAMSLPELLEGDPQTTYTYCYSVTEPRAELALDFHMTAEKADQAKD